MEKEILTAVLVLAEQAASDEGEKTNPVNVSGEARDSTYCDASRRGDPKAKHESPAAVKNILSGSGERKPPSTGGYKPFLAFCPMVAMILCRSPFYAK